MKTPKHARKQRHDRLDPVQAEAGALRHSRQPGGISVDQAMQRADAAVEQHRAGATTALRDAMDKLDALARSRDLARIDECYELSCFVLDIAGIFQPPLCRAANSLCELALRMKAAGKWTGRRSTCTSRACACWPTSGTKTTRQCRPC